MTVDDRLRAAHAAHARAGRGDASPARGPA